MSKEQTIHLTGRPPIRIEESAWPVIARAVWHNGKEPGMSTDRAYVRVRRHADGRTIVYGLRAEGSYEQRGGFLIDAGEDGITEAVHKMCALVGLDPQEVFDDMPAEAL